VYIERPLKPENMTILHAVFNILSSHVRNNKYIPCFIFSEGTKLHAFKRIGVNSRKLSIRKYEL